MGQREVWKSLWQMDTKNDDDDDDVVGNNNTKEMETSVSEKIRIWHEWFIGL